MTRVEIAVDELLVHGLTPAEARAAADALERRLAALAGEGVPARTREEASRRLPPVEAGSPAELGGAVAEALWSAVGGTR